MHDQQVVAKVCHPCELIHLAICCVLNLNLDLHSKPALQPCIPNTINIERPIEAGSQTGGGLSYSSSTSLYPYMRGD